jgi:hypothetical protein
MVVGTAVAEVSLVACVTEALAERKEYQQQQRQQQRQQQQQSGSHDIPRGQARRGECSKLWRRVAAREKGRVERGRGGRAGRVNNNTEAVEVS